MFEIAFFLGQSQFHQSFHMSLGEPSSLQPPRALPTRAITTGGHNHWGRGKAIGVITVRSHSYQGPQLLGTATVDYSHWE